MDTMNVSWNGYNCYAELGMYANRRLMICLKQNKTLSSGLKDRYGNVRHKVIGVPILTASVNLPDVPILDNPNLVAIKDYSENTGVLGALIQAGIVGEPVLTARSGFVDIPICPLLVPNPYV